MRKPGFFVRAQVGSCRQWRQSNSALVAEGFVSWSPYRSSGLRGFEMSFDFFQRLAFRFRQEERRGHEVDDSACRKTKEHGCVPVFANRGQENRGNGR